MIKVSMLATLIAGLAMGGNIAVDSRPQKGPEARDTKIIVEVDRSLESLTKEGVKNVQSIVYNNIKQYVTPNIRFVTSYSVLNNAFAISINSKYVESVKSLPGVKSVTVNKLRLVTQSVDRAPTPEEPDPINDYGGKINQSAETMNYDPYSKDTKAGEGTVIAVLDNEFYFRAKNAENDGFYHETFTDFKNTEGVKVRWSTRPDITKTHAYSPEDKEADNEAWHAIVDATPLGEEGSLYFNKKVPFYFDYGGDPEYTGADPEHDFDVSSTRDYHGSHVASIATGHAITNTSAPIYYGIAPKAQLVAMKVFTNFKASKTDQALGFSNQSGAYDIPLLNALEDCILLGVDGINMSLGSDLDDFDADSISMRTLTRLHEEGILSSISAGNSGKTSYAFAGGYQNWTSEMVETGILGGYANQVDSMSIASAQPGKTFYASAFRMHGLNIAYQDQIVNVGGSFDYEEEEEHRISDLIETYGSEIQWEYIPGYGDTNDYGNGTTAKDVEGKIAVVNRGSIDFETKVKVAIEKQAIGLVIINNDPTASDFNFRCSFGEYKPTIPVALVLMRDKTKFSENTDEIKKFEIVKDEIDDNPEANTLSDFSSDGAAYNLDLKPEIAAPGDSIRGAVPPQTKDDRTLRPLTTYEFLSGTSMSAPNYAGAQSVVLSKKAYDLKDDLDALVAYRKTVDMRLMSTAVPMKDYDISPEINPSYPLETKENQHDPSLEEDDYYGYESSPRIQGAGMVNLGNAYKTDVYLEGMDLKGNPIGKSKIALRNSPEINEGTVSLKFLAHNESNADKRYMASFSVMRPAIKASNEIVARNYDYQGEIDTFSQLPGCTYWRQYTKEGQPIIVEENTKGEVEVGYVYKVTRDLKYQVKVIDEHTHEESLEDRTIAVGRYCCTDVYEKEVTPDPDHPEYKETWVYATYEPLESSNYQSTQDTKLAVTTPVEVVVKANGTTEISLPEFNLSETQKEELLDFYSYGTYLEGFITLKSENGDNIDLSMPWMGFFAGEGKTYNDAPVVEPFSFEKDATSIYPSELVNDIGYSLINKTYIDMGSTWVTTYIEPGKSFNSDSILRNDQSLSNLADGRNSSYKLLGTDLNGNFYENPEENLYVGNPITSNTMIIQQFMLRSVDDNYYTITNKSSGQVIARSALEDMLFGERYGRYPLYKSHVDGGYLSGGYIAHRAWGVIPLYDGLTGAPFAAGEYEITFNYLLAGTSQWVSKSYTLHLCSEEPSITNITVLEDSVRFHYQDENIAHVAVGTDVYEQSEEEKAGKYIELTKERIDSEITKNWNKFWVSGRLFIELKNKAYGRTGVIIRFEEDEYGETLYNEYTIAEHYSFAYNNDFEDLLNEVKYVTVDNSKITYIDLDGYVRIRRYNDPVPASGGCGGNISTTSILLASLAGALAIIIAFARKRRKLGGKE